MTIRRALVQFVRRWALVAVVALVVVAGAVVVTLLATPQYRATSSVFFSLPSGTSGSDLFQGGNFAQQQAVGYAELVDTPTVLEPVIKQLGLGGSSAEALSGQVTATTLPNTAIVDIDVTSTSAQQAADIVNAAASQLVVVVRQLAPHDAAGKSAMDATIIRQALPPTAPYSPRLLINVLAALVGGIILGVGIDLLVTRVLVPDSGGLSPTDGAPLGAESVTGQSDPWPPEGPAPTRPEAPATATSSASEPTRSRETESLSGH